MTVGDIRKQLAGFSDDTPVVFNHHPDNYQEIDVEFCGFHAAKGDGPAIAECFLRLIDWDDEPDDCDDDEDAEYCQCANCRHIWNVNYLNEIKDFHQRVQAGQVVPGGECPECGALAYLIE